MQAVFEYLDPGESRESFVLYNSHKASEDETRGQNRMLATMQSFILALVRLRRNFHVHHLPYLFRVSEGTVANTFTNWTSFIYIKFCSVCIWPSSLAVKQKFSHSMKEKFPNVRCIVDCIEFKAEAQSSLTLHKCCTQTTKATPLQSSLFNPDLWEPEK